MRKFLLYLILAVISIIMLYPLLWLFGASFKSNDEIFTTIWFMPKSFDTDVYKKA